MELKTAIDNVKQAKVLLSDANNIMSANVSHLKNIESENAKLRHEIFDKHMELPLGADGVPIRLGDLVWYVGPDHEITNDDPQQVVGLVTVFAADGIYVMTRDYTDKAIRPELLTHKAPEPPDSWEKVKTVIHFQGTSDTVTVDVDMVEMAMRDSNVLPWQVFGNNTLVNMGSVTYVEVIG